MRDSTIDKTRKALLGKTADELAYILGQHCGRNRVILSEKIYGFVLHQKTVEEMWNERAFEDAFLIDNPEDT